MMNIDDKLRAQLNSMRQKNPESIWLFPVRMENSSSIEWKPNLVEAIACFKKPITEATWKECVRRKLIAAETPEEQELLAQWWDKGWKETPQLPYIASYGNPMLCVRQNALGETLEKIYPTNSSAMEELGCNRKQLVHMCNGVEMPFARGIKIIPMREKTDFRIITQDKTRWTLFSRNNTIITRTKTMAEMAKFLGVNQHFIVDIYRKRPAVFFNGDWLWYDEWGLIPTAPNGEVLPEDWRESRKSTQ